MWRRGDRRVADLQRDRGDVLHALQELVAQVLRLDVEDIWREDRTAIIDLSDSQTVRERRDVQHVEESGLAGTDAVAFLDQVDVVLKGGGREALLHESIITR